MSVSTPSNNANRVVAFSILKISGVSISMPDVRISLVKKESNELEVATGFTKGPEEWWSIYQGFLGISLY